MKNDVRKIPFFSTIENYNLLDICQVNTQTIHNNFPISLILLYVFLNKQLLGKHEKYKRRKAEIY